MSAGGQTTYTVCVCQCSYGDEFVGRKLNGKQASVQRQRPQADATLCMRSSYKSHIASKLLRKMKEGTEERLTSAAFVASDNGHSVVGEA